MGMLKHIRWELVARAMASGATAQQVAQKAGLADASYAAQLMQRDDIKKRAYEIIEDGLGSAELTKEYIAGQLVEILGVSAADFFEIDPQNPNNEWSIVPPHRWSAAMSNLCTGIEFDRYGQPKVKFESRLRILELAGRALGMWKDGLELSGPNGGPIENVDADMSAADAAKLYGAAIGQIPYTPRKAANE